MSSPSRTPNQTYTELEEERLSPQPEQDLLTLDFSRYLADATEDLDVTNTPADTYSDPDRSLSSEPLVEDPNHATPDNEQDNNAVQDFSASPSQLRSVLVEASRTAARLKLHPYQVSRVKSFVSAPWGIQMAETFCQMLTLDNKLDLIISQQPLFTVDKALAKTVKAYALGVFLSEKLTAYKGTIPTNHVYRIITKHQINTPKNLSKNPYAQDVIKAYIGNELTQLRSTLKKAIDNSIEKKIPIYRLASKLIEDMDCEVCIPLCARLAVLRKVLVSMPGLNIDEKKYWDTVDGHLRAIRACAGNNADNLRKLLAGSLRDDRRIYCMPGEVYDIPVEGGTSDFENNINGGLAA